MDPAELLAWHEALRLDREIVPFTSQPVPRFRLTDRQVGALDETLTATARRGVGLSAGARLLDAAPDLSAVVAAERSELVVIAGAEVRFPVPEAEAACLFPGGHLLAAAPVSEQATGIRVLLIDLAAGRVLDEVTLDLPEAHVGVTRHPVAPLAALGAGFGQDGSRVFTVAEAGGRLEVQELAGNVIAASFDPAGTRLLLTPHPTFGSTLRVLSWPDGRLLSTATAADLGLTGESFGVCGCYLRDDLVLAMTKAGRIVVLDGQLGLLGEVGLTAAGKGPARQGPAWNGPDFMIGLGPASFAVQTWKDGTASASAWRLPPALTH